MEEKLLSKTASYFLEALKFENYISLPENESDYCRLYDSEIKDGNAKYKHGLYSKDLYSYLENSKANNSEKENIKVCLIRKFITNIFTDDSGSAESQPFSLFYIRAELTHDNKFEFSKDKNINPVVWTKQFEEPLSLNGCSLKIKTDKDVERSKLKDWKDGIEHILKTFEERYGCEINASFIKDINGNNREIFSFPDNKGEWVVIKDNSVSASGFIKKLLGFLSKIEDQNFPSLLATMIKGGVKKEYIPVQAGSKIKEHVGQMKSSFPMADAQRTALHAFQKLEEGNVLAVSGPPGTGKTTMLQTIVADMIVRYAYEEKAAPIILVSSSNNKAITNVIDSFAIKQPNNQQNLNKKDQMLFSRWITFNNDQPLPLAVYMPSQNAMKKLPNGVKPFCLHDYANLRKKETNDERRKHFIKCASDAGFIGSNVDSIKYQIHEELKSTIRAIKRVVDESQGKSSFLHKTVTYLQRKMGLQVETPEMKLRNMAKNFTSEGESLTKVLDSIIENENLKIEEKIDKLLDPSLRYKAFWLAVHYYEACWFEALEKLEKNPEGNIPIEEKLKELSMVCPCSIATFFKAPGIFYNKEKENPLLSFADLLIVDEAGQVTPEVGLPTFALAKKAIVMGDVKQIPPVYSITGDAVDKQLWSESGLPAEDENLPLLSVSKSSVMKIASNRSMFADEDEEVRKITQESLMLKEHYRCFDEIIAYCNELMYSNKLEPRKGSIEKKKPNSFLPAMGMIHVSGNSEQCKTTGSRYNKVEANAIAQWIKQNSDSILKDYKKKDEDKELNLEDVVCIITPFKAQTKKIKDALENKKIQVGTVHTFQGAEFPIVIFSTTYGNKEKFSFIENQEVGYPIMNVAVSRAKEHFILFTSKKKEDISTVIKDGKKVPNKDSGSYPEDLLIDMCQDMTPDE